MVVAGWPWRAAWRRPTAWLPPPGMLLGPPTSCPAAGPVAGGWPPGPCKSRGSAPAMHSFQRLSCGCQPPHFSRNLQGGRLAQLQQQVRPSSLPLGWRAWRPMAPQVSHTTLPSAGQQPQPRPAPAPLTSGRPPCRSPPERRARGSAQRIDWTCASARAAAWASAAHRGRSTRACRALRQQHAPNGDGSLCCLLLFPAG